ncbi:hypothetical protein CBS101457_005487 [Exobasidium rhododendri]|nr:hypothetical protein CBS101457_005487 [Exobasidium rhododendri]
MISVVHFLVLSLVTAATLVRAFEGPMCEVRHPDLKLVSMIEDPRFRKPSWSSGVVHDFISDDNSVIVDVQDPAKFPGAETLLIANNATHPKIALTWSTHPTQGTSHVTRYFHLENNHSCRVKPSKSHRYLIKVAFYHSHYAHRSEHKNVWDD